MLLLEVEELSRIAQRNQARFTSKIFLELAGIDLGSSRMPALVLFNAKLKL